LYDTLGASPRLLMEADLRPVQGHRFQPTGFPDLGPARYTDPSGVQMLLVESPQSVANHMELACWDSVEQDLIEPLRGIPFIRVLDVENQWVSNSLLEAHRINSEYIVGKKQKTYRILSRKDGAVEISKKLFRDEFTEEIGYQSDGRVQWKRFRCGLLKYDLNSLLHGCFLEEIGGRLRVTRAISGFIEAADVQVAESGGVKNNIVHPALKEGKGNVPYPRTEFTAKKITAYFNLDLELLRSYGLPQEAEQLLIALALFKVCRFLSTGLRVRTACDLEPVDGGLRATRLEKVVLPPEDDLLTECSRFITSCEKHFADPAITEVQWKK
ncbi:MAG: type I-U CRISPR-associated protein Cas7, partial [Armatimonadetes bacterium]|nr:type I-U CRISPR-associated protein Cas7 [Armatimonadota bacterium]